MKIGLLPAVVAASVLFSGSAHSTITWQQFSGRIQVLPNGNGTSFQIGVVDFNT